MTKGKICKQIIFYMFMRDINSNVNKEKLDRKILKCYFSTL